MHFFKDREIGRDACERSVELHRILRPAFKAGVHAHVRLARHRAQLVGLFDRVETGLAAYDMDGTLLHQNPAMTRVLEDDPERARLRSAIDRAAEAIGALVWARKRVGSTDEAPMAAAAAYREITTACGRYQIGTSILGQGLLGCEESVVVTVDRLWDQPARERETVPGWPSETDVIERFWLTRAQARVALLLAQGMTNAEIAKRLSISPSTARNHTARVREKLDVSTRSKVAGRLFSRG